MAYRTHRNCPAHPPPAHAPWRGGPPRHALLAALLAALLGASAPAALAQAPAATAAASDGAEDADDTASAQPPASTPASRPNFELDISTPKPAVRSLLEQHLELQRYRTLPGLRRTELLRLLSAADADIRKLLGTLGYFAPTIELELQDPPRDSEQLRVVRIQVDPGQSATVAGVDIQVHSPQGAAQEAAPTQNDPSRWQRQMVSRNWGLPVGQPFTQSAWASAKKSGLTQLQARRYPTASISSSQADIDADTLQAQLQVRYETGPLYRFGPLRIEGAQRYDVAGITRLARLPVGREYQESTLLEVQQRLASSGLYDSVFLTLDTEAAPPGQAEVQVPVIAQVREALLQKWEYGLGISTDTGPRLSVQHTHNRVPGLGWQASSKLQLDRRNPLLSTRLHSMPDDTGWNWFVSALAQRSDLADYQANSISLSAGRSKSEDKIDRQYFLRYDLANPQGDYAPPKSTALSINHGWTGRYFNNFSNPTRGYGLASELGLGMTLTPERTPFVRLAARGLYYYTLDGRDNATKRRSRLALRAQVGSLMARQDAVMPLTLLFLSGGDTTVRGYSYQSIGTRTQWGQLIGGRHTLSGSLEWQRPIMLAGNTRDWEQTLFVDAGTVSDNFSFQQIFVGAGAGIRWNSPVGPLQADLAYGFKSQKIRLHLRLGFNF